MATAKQNKSASRQKGSDFTYIIIYILGFLTGILFFIISGSDKRKKLHSIQAILLGVAAFIVAFVLGIFLWGLSTLVLFLIWIYGLYIGYMASTGVDVEIPVITDFAKQYA